MGGSKMKKKKKASKQYYLEKLNGGEEGCPD
jgi:hypothetical protein